MKTSRQKILEYIDARGAAAAPEIAAALHMTAANARYQLAALAADGVLQMVAERSAGQRGRPTQFFRRAVDVAAHGLDHLAQALLELELARLDPDQPEQLDQLAQRLAEALAQQMKQALPLAEARTLAVRLQNTVRRLAAFHYQARWEAHATGPRLIFGHCPYRAVLPQFPQLCRMDQQMLKELLSTQVSQAARLEQVAPGLTQCVFLVK